MTLRKVGRLKADEPTEVIAIHVSIGLAARLDRYIKLLNSAGTEGAKASKNSVVTYALRRFLDAKYAEMHSLRDLNEG